MTVIQQSPPGDVRTKVGEFDLLEWIWGVPTDDRAGYVGGLGRPRNLRRFLVALAVIVGLVIAVTILAVTGLLGSWYEWFWENTLGEPYTHWFRRHPVVFVPIVLTTLGGLFLIVGRPHWRTLVVTTSWFAVGFLFGHVIW